MSIKNVSHIAIGVRDMDRALPFWTEVVGLRVALDTEEEVPIGAQPVRRRGVYLKHNQGAEDAFVVLDQQLTDPPRGTPKPLFEVGVHHFGFWVDDVDAIAERARAAGVAILAGPDDADTVTYGEPPGGRVRYMFVNDHEGNVIQFDQRLT